MDIDAKELFSALSHDIRLRCIILLLSHDELCVCEVTYAIGVAQPKISLSLGQLRKIGLVKDRREGLWIHYHINPDLPLWVKELLYKLHEGVKNAAPYINDETVVAAMPNRPGAPRCA